MKIGVEFELQSELSENSMLKEPFFNKELLTHGLLEYQIIWDGLEKKPYIANIVHLVNNKLIWKAQRTSLGTPFSLQSYLVDYDFLSYGFLCEEDESEQINEVLIEKMNSFSKVEHLRHPESSISEFFSDEWWDVHLYDAWRSVEDEFELYRMEDQTRPDCLEEILEELGWFMTFTYQRSKQCLDKMIHLGPLRVIPDQLTLNRKEYEGTWFDGKAAWFEIRDLPDDVLHDINLWLSDKERLNTGYKILRNSVLELPTDSEILTRLQTGTIDEIEDLHGQLRELRSKVFVRLFDEALRTMLQPNEIGVGISQIIPILIALRGVNRSKLVCIEQPELHLHPACQVGLGDLFIESIIERKAKDQKSIFTEDVDKFTTIVETHSEHLILRLLRRMREKVDDELPRPELDIKPEDVSIVYFHKVDDAIAIKEMRINKKGEFIDKWPNGFFEERMEELY